MHVYVRARVHAFLQKGGRRVFFKLGEGMQAMTIISKSSPLPFKNKRIKTVGFRLEVAGLLFFLMASTKNFEGDLLKCVLETIILFV